MSRTHRSIDVPANQAIRGLRVGYEGEVVCLSCDALLGAGADVEVHAYRMSDEPYWTVSRLLCADCAEDGAGFIATLGATEVLATARIATLSDTSLQEHEAVLVEPRIQDHSPPTEGGRP